MGSRINGPFDCIERSFTKVEVHVLLFFSCVFVFDEYQIFICNNCFLEVDCIVLTGVGYPKGVEYNYNLSQATVKALPSILKHLACLSNHSDTIHPFIYNTY